MLEVEERTLLQKTSSCGWTTVKRVFKELKNYLCVMSLQKALAW